MGLYATYADFSSEGDCGRSLTARCETFGYYNDYEGVAWNEETFRECAAPMLTAADECDAEPFFGGGGDYVILGVDTTQEQCRNAAFAEGTVEEGGDCYAEQECAGEARCVFDDNDAEDEVTISFKGKCVVPALGDRCAGAYDCPEGAFCGYDENEGADICQALAGLGEECGFGRACVQGNYCDYDASPSTCAEKKAEGSVCNDYIECLSYRCEYDEVSGDSLCVAQLAAGEQCIYDEDCESFNCNEDDVCAASEGATYVYDVCTGA